MARSVQHKNNHNHRSVPRTLLWLGLIFGAGFYVVDLLVDVYVFRYGGLVDELLHPSVHELWMRLSVLCISVFFSSFAYLQLKREHQSAERVQTAERFLNSVVDNIPDMVFIKDAQELRFVRINTAAERILGFSRKELLGRSDYDLFPEMQADFFTGKDREVLQSGKVLAIPEEEIRTKEHGTRILRTKKVPISDADGQPAYLLGIAEDITDTWKARQELQNTETRFQTLFNSAAEFIFVIDADGRIQLTNHHVIEHSGYAENEVVGSNIKKFLTVESQQICDSNFPELLETGSIRTDVDFVCKDGRILSMECSATAVPDGSGDFTTFLFIQRDVTERARASAALADSERRFRAIFNSTFQLIGLLDVDGTVLEVNQTALSVAGLGQADIVGRPFWEIIWWGLSSKARERVKTAIRDAAAGKPVRYEEEIVVGDGSVRTFDFTLKPVLDEQGNPVLIIPEGRDITDSRLAEEDARRNLQEAAHVMRLGTMGELATTIAHELNQPLTALVSYCGTARAITQEIISPPDRLGELLELAMEQAHRAADIIRHFREFGCKGNNRRQHVNLNHLLEKVVGLLRGELRNTGINVDLHPAEVDCLVKVDDIQIEQVIMNLLRNSIDAIVQCGREDGHIDVYLRLLPDKAVEVTVIDNGPGVAPEMQDHLFEPFHSGRANGMGVGLSISRSIIESHGGKMWFNRYQQGGAQFGMVLPGCEAGDEGQ